MFVLAAVNCGSVGEPRFFPGGPAQVHRKAPAPSLRRALPRICPRSLGPRAPRAPGPAPWTPASSAGRVRAPESGVGGYRWVSTATPTRP